MNTLRYNDTLHAERERGRKKERKKESKKESESTTIIRPQNGLL